MSLFYGVCQLFVEIPDVEAEGNVWVEVVTEVSFENFDGFFLGLLLETFAFSDFLDQAGNLMGTDHRETWFEHKTDRHIDSVPGISCLASEHFSLPVEELDFQDAPVVFYDVDVGAEPVL